MPKARLKKPKEHQEKEESSSEENIPSSSYEKPKRKTKRIIKRATPIKK